jgi:hypothetical protein
VTRTQQAEQQQEDGVLARETRLRLRARSPHHDGQEVSAVLLPGLQRAPGFPMLLVEGDVTASLEAALTNYEVVEASTEEREVLQRWGHPFGGVQ